jgi:hypothetical protein
MVDPPPPGSEWGVPPSTTLESASRRIELQTAGHGHARLPVTADTGGGGSPAAREEHGGRYRSPGGPLGFGL